MLFEGGSFFLKEKQLLKRVCVVVVVVVVAGGGGWRERGENWTMPEYLGGILSITIFMHKLHYGKT